MVSVGEQNTPIIISGNVNCTALLKGEMESRVDARYCKLVHYLIQQF
jgi:hypothetical protein